MIKAINSSNIFFNKFTKVGKKRQELINNMKDNGCQIIRERKIGCNTRVILGYKNEYSRLANYAAMVSRDGNYEEKFSECKYSPLPSSIRKYTVEKFKIDNEGNKKSEHISKSFLGGKIIKDETRVTKIGAEQSFGRYCYDIKGDVEPAFASDKFCQEILEEDSKHNFKPVEMFEELTPKGYYISRTDNSGRNVYDRTDVNYNSVIVHRIDRYK